MRSAYDAMISGEAAKAQENHREGPDDGASAEKRGRGKWSSTPLPEGTPRKRGQGDADEGVQISGARSAGYAIGGGGTGYSDLEYDLGSGGRGKPRERVGMTLCYAVMRCHDALVVGRGCCMRAICICVCFSVCVCLFCLGGWVGGFGLWVCMLV